MKCIHFYNPENRITRVSDEEADRAVSSGKARYVPRSEWKRKIRECGAVIAQPIAKRKAA